MRLPERATASVPAGVSALLMTVVLWQSAKLQLTPSRSPSGATVREAPVVTALREEGQFCQRVSRIGKQHGTGGIATDGFAWVGDARGV